MTAISNLTLTSYVEQLNKEREMFPQHNEILCEIQNYLDKKLYHQFTLTLLTYLKEDTHTGLRCAELVYNLVDPIKNKLNALFVCEMVKLVCDLLDCENALAFVDLFSPAFQDNKDAVDSLNITRAKSNLKYNNLTEAQQLLQTIEANMKKRFSVAIQVNSEYQWVCVLYYRVMKEYANLYDHILLYFAYTDLNKIPNDVLKQVAFELCYCSLVSPNKFDFGELRMQPAMAALEATPDQNWILDFIQAGAEGSLQLFKEACTKHETVFKETFADKISDVSEKIMLVALLELAFQKPKNNRVLTFQEIAEHCKIPHNEVELLLIKALSLKLIDGKIDGIDKLIELTWVKPRIINMERIVLLRNQLESWRTSVDNVASVLEKSVNELLTV